MRSKGGFRRRSRNALRKRRYKTEHYGAKWANISVAVRKRDNSTCRICHEGPIARKKRHGVLEVHHLLRKSKGGQDTMSNLISLCDRCHAKQHRHLKGRG